MSIERKLIRVNRKRRIYKRNKVKNKVAERRN